MVTAPEVPAEVAAVVAALGHDLAWDAPHDLSRGGRWTCRHPACGRAVLQYGSNIYGSALDEACDRTGAM